MKKVILSLLLLSTSLCAGVLSPAEIRQAEDGYYDYERNYRGATHEGKIEIKKRSRFNFYRKKVLARFDRNKTRAFEEVMFTNGSDRTGWKLKDEYARGFRFLIFQIEKKYVKGDDNDIEIFRKAIEDIDEIDKEVDEEEQK